MSSNPVFFWEINAHDGERLAAFYNTVFDWAAESDDSGFHFVESTDDEGNGIAGGIFTGKGQLPPHRAIYVRVDSIQSTLGRARDAGAKVLSCGTCLDYYDRSDKLVVGEPTNMRDTVNAMLAARQVIRP